MGDSDENCFRGNGIAQRRVSNLERALTCARKRERQELLNVVIVGGGATGVEIAGALGDEALRDSLRLS